MAEGARGRGINVALPGYTLAPEASLTEIVAEIRLALDFLTAQACVNSVSMPLASLLAAGRQ